jgi:hypothetical protein
LLKVTRTVRNSAGVECRSPGPKYQGTVFTRKKQLICLVSCVNPLRQYQGQYLLRKSPFTEIIFLVHRSKSMKTVLFFLYILGTAAAIPVNFLSSS